MIFTRGYLTAIIVILLIILALSALEMRSLRAALQEAEGKAHVAEGMNLFHDEVTKPVLRACFRVPRPSQESTKL